MPYLFNHLHVSIICISVSDEWLLGRMMPNSRLRGKVIGVVLYQRRKVSTSVVIGFYFYPKKLQLVSPSVTLLYIQQPKNIAILSKIVILEYVSGL